MLVDETWKVNLETKILQVHSFKTHLYFGKGSSDFFLTFLAIPEFHEGKEFLPIQANEKIKTNQRLMQYFSKSPGNSVVRSDPQLEQLEIKTGI